MGAAALGGEYWALVDVGHQRLLLFRDSSLVLRQITFLADAPCTVIRGEGYLP
jgi:hypothetical protein